jgi:hypothetical protein
MQSSSTRRKTAFVPWLAALIIGATAHAGWLIHELREPRTLAAAPVHVVIDARSQVVKRARHTPALARARTLPPRCRFASGPPEAGDDELDLDMWIEQTDRYAYAIDRRVLERVALPSLDGALLDLIEPIELRNIRAGTPLFVLGLRTGDRVHAITTRLLEVEVAIERRGRPLELVYRLI